MIPDEKASLHHYLVWILRSLGKHSPQTPLPQTPLPQTPLLPSLILLHNLRLLAEDRFQDIHISDSTLIPF